MPNYNIQLQSNNIDLQSVLQALQNKASGGEQATPEISVGSNGLITATAGTKSSTYQLAFQSAKTITPSTISQVAVSSGHYTGGDVTVAGDSNLLSENIKSGVSIFGVSGTAEVGGEIVVDDVSKAIIKGTITSIEDDSIETIRSYAFFYCSRLTTASFPVCTSIGNNAFQSCSNLTTALFPACRYVGPYAFTSCHSLITTSFPVCTNIGSSAFFYCYSLTTASFPACTNIDPRAFFGCYSLTTVDFSVCTRIRSFAFAYCHSLTTANFPMCTNISSSAFVGCQTLSSLAIGASSVCTLSNSNAFSSTPFAGYSAYFSGTPHIYVPSSLITAYQSATNWTYFSSYFSAIESLEV